MSIQQQMLDDNQKKNQSFVRRLNEDLYTRNDKNDGQEGEYDAQVYNEFDDLRQMQKERNDLPQMLTDAAQQRQLQQLRIGMFDDMKPIQMLPPTSQNHG